MAWNTWAIDGDNNVQPKHPASVARLQTYVAFQGCEGVVDPLDLRVMAQPTPNTTIRVMPGAASILNRATGVRSQAYAVELTEPDTLPVSPTDSSGPRSDLVVVRVENPFLAGESFDLPPNPEDGPYTHIRIVQGVPNNTTDYYDLNPGTYGSVTVSPTDSVITLARIDLPASTATVQQSHLRELRSMAEPGGRRVGEEIIESNPWFENTVSSVPQNATPPGNNNAHILPSNGTYKFWPPEADWTLPVPEWATGAEVWIDADCQSRDGDVWGDAVLAINGQTVSAPVQFDINYTGNPANETVKFRGTIAIPPELRGTRARFQMRARSTSNVSGRLWAKWWTYSTLMVQFKKYPVYN